MSTATFQGLKLEVEFVDGTWTDISTYAEWTQRGTLKLGRTSIYSRPQTGVFSCVLDNTDGRFTPKRSVLADGVTAHPYYPNVTARRRVRFGFTISGAYYQRFQGYVESWPPTTPDGRRSRIVLNAYDEQQLWAGVRLQPCIATEIIKDTPRAWYPLADQAGALFTLDRTGNKPNLIQAGNAAVPVTFGGAGPVGAEAAGAAFADGAILVGADFNFVHNQATVEFWMRLDLDAASGTALGGLPYIGTSAFRVFWLEGSPGPMYLDAGAEVGHDALVDGLYHHYVITYDRANQVQLYIDGVLVSYNLFCPDLPFRINYLAVGGESTLDSTITGLKGGLSNLAFYDYVLSQDRITAHTAAGIGYAGETVDQRVLRLLEEAWLDLGLDYGIGNYGDGAYGGSPGSELDGSYVVLNAYQQGGRFVLQALQDATTSEGGGADVYVDNRTGLPRFLYRGHRDPGPPALTVTAGADDDAGTYTPDYGSRGTVNSIDPTSMDGSASTVLANVQDDDSVREFSRSNETLSSWAKDPTDVVYNAEERIAALAWPQFRVQRLTVDLWTSANDLWAAAAVVTLADRIRYDQVPVKFAPRSYLDLLVQGIQDDWSDQGYTITFDTDPVDNPPRMLLDDLVYGRFTGDGITLHSTITAGSTAVGVDAPVGAPQFTTDPTDLPFAVRIDEEDMTVTNVAIGSGGSTQTLTVTRGANGSQAVGHAAGVAIDLAPAPAWSI